MSRKYWITILALLAIAPMQARAQRGGQRSGGGPSRAAQWQGGPVIAPMLNPVQPMSRPIMPMINSTHRFPAGAGLNIPGRLGLGRNPRQLGYAPFPAFFSAPLYAPLPVVGVEPPGLSQPSEEPRISRQIESIRDELQDLRAEIRASVNSTRQAAVPVEVPPAVVENRPATMLVFNDGRRSEVENYAIVGGNVLIFEGRTSRQIPTGDIDFDATERVNRERGVWFMRPKTNRPR